MTQPYQPVPSAPMRYEPVPPAVIFKALERVRNAARGNGIDPDTITLHGFTGQMVAFEAGSLFEIKPTIMKKSVPGKEAGEVCGSAADLHGRIAQATEKTTIDTVIIDAATSFLQHRKDMGFMADGLGLKLDRLNRTFLFYNTCTNCTAGRINCMNCHAAGTTNCVRCHGHRTAVCPQCRGVKTIKDKNGHMGACRKCNGHGDIACIACHSSGKMKCRPCLGTGQTPCPRCAATGIISDMAYVSFEAKTHFMYDRDILPEGLPQVIDRMGPQIALNHHADIKILKEKEQRAAQQHYEAEEHAPLRDELIVPFAVRVPWGRIEFRMNDKILKGRLFGLHPRLMNVPAFIEKAIGPGLDRLTQAAHGLGPVWNNIHEAIRFRIIADAMVAASAMTQKKAIQAMCTRWSIGVSGDVCDKMTMLADKAYRNVSKLPRIAGLMLGLLIAGIVDLAYIAGPGRAMIYAHGVPFIAMIALDAVLVAGTGYIAQSISRFITRKSLWRLFEKILPAKQLHKIRPKAGSVGIYAYAGAVVVFAGVVAGTWFTGHPVPDWVSYLIR